MQSLDDLFTPGPDRGWMRRAACHGSAVHFPELPAGRPWPSQLARHAEDTAAAKAVCADCPVRAERLDYSVADGDEFGVWGGLTEEERRPLLDGQEAA